MEYGCCPFTPLWNTALTLCLPTCTLLPLTEASRDTGKTLGYADVGFRYDIRL